MPGWLWAGENLVKFAGVINDIQGRWALGVGAVMGSRLKSYCSEITGAVKWLIR